MENEDELIHWLKSRAAGLGGELIGDDAAILPAGGPWAVTVDQQIENVHFLPGLDPAILARRLLAVNLSDLAAMGARPAYGFLSLAGPASWNHRRFFDALLTACAPLDLKLAGGDLARRPEVAAGLTLIGRAGHDDGRFLRRHLARPGERLWIGGPIGESALGFALLQRGAHMTANNTVHLPAGDFDQCLDANSRRLGERAVRRHLCPQPQLALGHKLLEIGGHAAMDISDGLAKDLDRMCRASRVSAHLDLSTLRPPLGFETLAPWVSKSWLELALGGGEDYVLCFTLDAGKEAPEGCQAIGEIRQGAGLYDQAGRPLPITGWDHLGTPGQH